MNESSESSRSTYRTLALLIVLAGILLRSVQFFSSPSMWEDEIALAFAIGRASWLEILGAQMGQNQIAPVGFAAVHKALMAFGARDDLTLRIPSFLASVSALGLAPFLLKRILAGPWALVGLTALAFSPPLIHYSGILKQYSLDVFFSIGLTLTLLILLERTDKKTSWLAWACGLAVLFSSTAVFLCAAGFAALAVHHFLGSRRDPDSPNGLDSHRSGAGRRERGPSFLVWGNLTFGLLVLPALLILHATAGAPAETREYMAVFWEGKLMPPFLDYPTWILDQARTLIPNLLFGLYMVPQPWLGSLTWLFLPIVALAGIGVLGRAWTRPHLVVLILFPVLGVLAASRLGAFPLIQRTCLFLVPQLLVLTLWGAGLLFSRASPAVRRPAALALGVVAAGPLFLNLPPYRPDHFEDLVVAVSERMESEDRFWVHEMSGWNWMFYARGVPRRNIRYGRCRRGEPRRQLRDVDRLRENPRVWFVFGRVHPLFLPEARTVLSYLRAIGTEEEVIDVPGTGPVEYSAHLFDLGEEGRLGNADADSFPVGDPVEVPSHLSCRYVGG